MYRNFKELMEHLATVTDKKTVAVAAAGDEEVLKCASEARKLGVANFVLLGNGEAIRSVLRELGEDPDQWTIEETASDKAAAERAVALASEGKADAIMKGLLPTATFLRALFNKEYGLVPPKTVVSQVTVTEYPGEDRMVLITDCAINVAPEYADKVSIINNAVSLAHRMGMECPKVACLAPVEVINEKMPETLDAAALAKASQRGQIRGCVVDGPLALDNALSEEAAKVKNIGGEVAGHADILMVPDLAAGNILDKSLRYFAHLSTGSAVIGARVPVIMTSRSDTAEGKLHAIALSVL